MRNMVLAGVLVMAVLFCVEARADAVVPPPVPDIGVSVDQYRVVYFQSDPLYVSQIPEGDNGFYVRFSIASGNCDICDLTDAALWVYYYSGHYVYVLVGGLEIKGISGGVDAIDVEFGTFNYYYPVYHPFDSGQFNVGVVHGGLASLTSMDWLTKVPTNMQDDVDIDYAFKLQVYNPWFQEDVMSTTLTQIPVEGSPSSLLHEIYRIPGTFWFESGSFMHATAEVVDEIYDLFAGQPFDLRIGSCEDTYEFSYIGWENQIYYDVVPATEAKLGIEIDYMMRKLDATTAERNEEKKASPDKTKVFAPDPGWIDLAGGPFQKDNEAKAINIKYVKDYKITEDKDRIAQGAENLTLTKADLEKLNQTERATIYEEFSDHTSDNTTAGYKKWIYICGAKYCDDEQGTTTNESSWKGCAEPTNAYAFIFVKKIEEDAEINSIGVDDAPYMNKWVTAHELAHILANTTSHSSEESFYDILGSRTPRYSVLKQIVQEGSWNFQVAGFSTWFMQKWNRTDNKYK